MFRTPAFGGNSADSKSEESKQETSGQLTTSPLLEEKKLDSVDLTGEQKNSI